MLIDLSLWSCIYIGSTIVKYDQNLRQGYVRELSERTFVGYTPLSIQKKFLFRCERNPFAGSLNPVCGRRLFRSRTLPRLERKKSHVTRSATVPSQNAQQPFLVMPENPVKNKPEQKTLTLMIFRVIWGQGKTRGTGSGRDPSRLP